ncbi:hypothetical protein DFH28DRAFT_1094528 [Melampsora americana]|nr:hypothetical protein DFH28DRAFT_1094528 [Melampsora americana]
MLIFLIFLIFFLVCFVTSYPLVPLTKGIENGTESFHSLAGQMISDEKLSKSSTSVSSSNADAHLIKSRTKRPWQGCGILKNCLNPTRQVDDAVISPGSYLGSSRKRVLSGSPTPPRPSIVDDAWTTWKEHKSHVYFRERLDLAVFHLSYSLSTLKTSTKSRRNLIQFMKELYSSPTSSKTERSILALIDRAVDLRNQGIRMDIIVTEYKLQAYELLKSIILDDSDEEMKLGLRTIERLLEAGGLPTRPQQVKMLLSASDQNLIEEWDMMAQSIIKSISSLLEIMENSKGQLRNFFKQEFLQMQARVTNKRVFDFFYKLSLTLRSESKHLDIIYASERDKFLERYLPEEAAIERKRMIEYTNLLEGDLNHMLEDMGRHQNISPAEVFPDPSHAQEGVKNMLEVHPESLKHFQRIPKPLSRDPAEVDSPSKSDPGEVDLPSEVLL